MNAINPYIGFNGKCRDAMTFYQECIGGELEFQETEDISTNAPKAGGEQDKIFHASLTKNGSQILMGSDMVDQDGYIIGNNIALAITCNSEEEIYSLFNKLSNGGNGTNPPKLAFWGGIFGTLVDQFGIKWMLNYNKPQTE